MQEVIDLFLIPKFNELGMNATGEWIESLEVRYENGSGQIWGKDYSYYLANGRANGKKPPIAPIEKWVNAKLGQYGSQGRSIAFAISNKISKQGTSWYEKGGSDLIEILSSKEVTDYVNKRTVEVLLSETILEIRRRTQEIFS